MFLPTPFDDPRPSVTVSKTLVLASLMSVQLFFFKASFERKGHDEKVLSKEVLNEYDTKYVHPSLNRPVRDVATQSRESFMSPGRTSREVEVYTPTTIVNRGFKINPNPSYVQHLADNVDTQSLYEETPARRFGRVSANLMSPTPAPSTGARALYPQPITSTSTGTDADYAPRNTSPQKPPSRQRSQPSLSQYRDPSSTAGFRNINAGGANDGGSLGVHTHAASPLRKSTGGTGLLRHQRSRENQRQSMGSPLKRVSHVGTTPATGSAAPVRYDYLGRPIEGNSQRTERNLFSSTHGGRGDGNRETRDGDGYRRRERDDRTDDGLKARFGGLRDGGTDSAGNLARERRPY